MPWTNEFNLPLALCRAIENITDDYDHSKDPNTFSVTELISAPRLTLLTRRHREEITRDYADSLYLIMGSAIHEVLRRADVEDGITEERLYKEYGEFTLSGKADLWLDGVITDWKVTAVAAMTREARHEWQAQPNLYAQLYRGAGFEVKEVRIFAILRDHSPYGHLHNDNYPLIPFVRKSVDLWTPDQCDEYAQVAFQKLKHAMARDDWELPSCTEEQRWTRPSDWALMKEGRASAMKKEDTELELEQYIRGKGTRFQNKDTSLKDGLSIVHRPGRDTRCADKPGRNVGYCPVREWCNYYHSEVKDKQ